MASLNAATLLQRPQHDFTWDERFSVRQLQKYDAEDFRVMVIPPEDLVTAFLKFQASHLSPPCFNFETLRNFLELADFPYLTGPASVTPSLRLALIDDRRDPAGIEDAEKDLDGWSRAELAREGMIQIGPNQVRRFTGQKRDWVSAKYAKDSPQGDHGFRRHLDEQKLYHKLNELRKANYAERRSLFFLNLTPNFALALAATVANRFAAHLRGYLERYLTARVYFRIWIADVGFAMEFHLPYLALRNGPEQIDARGRRKCLPMLRDVDGPNDDVFYYEAETSFLITGVDEWHWTAYCCVDTFFDGELEPDWYLQNHFDGPIGGSRQEFQPVWNPREYFLLVCSRRMSQATREWTNLIAVLNSRLDTYEERYHSTMETEDFFDDERYTWTKNYTWAVATLRRFHDALLTTIESWQEFAVGDLQYFETKNLKLDALWKGYIDSLFKDMSELRYLQRSLLQRIQTFDWMRDGLVSTSALRESRYSTKQGKDIEVLTNMTVAYLPFGLATGLFSVSTSSPSSVRWGSWTVVAVLLCGVTFYLAFGAKIKSRWREGWKGKGQ